MNNRSDGAWARLRCSLTRDSPAQNPSAYVFPNRWVADDPASARAVARIAPPRSMLAAYWGFLSDYSGIVVVALLAVWIGATLGLANSASVPAT